MNLRAILFGLIALLAAGATVFGAKSWLDKQRAALAPKPVAAAAPKPATQILVAKQNLPQGTLLQPGNLHWQAWPDSGVIDAHVVRDKRKLEDFVGSVVRNGIAAGEPITDMRVVFPGERGFLAAVLEVGMRAVTVPIDATSGIAGFVFPGDRVDLILTHSPDRGESGRNQRKASETVLSSVRVLAIDQRTNDQANKPDLGRTATLEVTAKQAEMIPIITELGRLSLALRSLESPDQLVSAEANDDPGHDPKRRKPGVRGETFTLDTEVSRLLDPPKKAGGGGGQTVSVVHGGKAKTVTFNRTTQGWVPVVEPAAAHADADRPEASPRKGEEGEK